MKLNGTKIVLAALMMTAASGVAIKAYAADSPLPAGTTAPAFTLPSQDNTPISLSEYKGKWVVLYFYPKDMTQGCTIEAHNFQRDLSKYKDANAVVLGVSLDTPGSHKSFCDKESLTFKLLADPEHKVVDEYGVPLGSMGPMHYAKRDTFLINPDGKIVKVWTNVDPQKHSDEVLAEIRSFSQGVPVQQ